MNFVGYAIDQGCQTGGTRRNILWPAKEFYDTVRMPGLRIWSSKNYFPKEKKIFELKLRENSHEVMVDNYYKSRVALQVAAREVINFFLEISTVSDYIPRFSEIAAWTGGDL